MANSFFELYFIPPTHKIDSFKYKVNNMLCFVCVWHIKEREDSFRLVLEL